MLAYADKVTTNQTAFLYGVQRVAMNLGIDPNWLMVVMWYESKLNPAARNPYSGATGLIQFMPSTALGLGTTVGALAGKSNVDQLPYVERYYRQFGNISAKVRNASDLYLYTFYPKAVGQSPNYVIFSEGSTGYAQNKALDKDGDGRITVRDIRNLINGYTPTWVAGYEGPGATWASGSWALIAFLAVLVAGTYFNKSKK